MRTEPYTLETRWTNRDAHGFNVCTLYVDGVKVGSCNGRGYDMTGTVVGDWIATTFQEELRVIADKAFCVRREGDQRQTVARDEKGRGIPGHLYGMTLDASTGEITLDGACGLESMWAVLEAIGFVHERLPARGPVRDAWQVSRVRSLTAPRRPSVFTGIRRRKPPARST